MSKIIDEETRDKVEVMTAYLMKKEIEVQMVDDGGLLAHSCGDKWYPVTTEPSWNWDKATWRIKPDGMTVDELVEVLNTMDGDLRVNLNFEDQNFDIDGICQDHDILDIFPGRVAR